ncbi:MAG: efflux RND transporter periplasmic adaptor subunit [Rhodothalassiaceae bacterium]
MRKLLVILAPVGVILLGILGVVALHATKPAPKKEVVEQRPASLYVESVRREPVTLEILSQGTVASRNEIDLISEVSGRIVEVAPAFVAGGTFRKGDLLLRIEDANYRFAVTEAEAQVAAAALAAATEEARAEVARKQWKWNEIEEKTDSPTALALKIPHVQDARARLAAARAQLERAQLDLAKTEIRAPFDGRMREKSAGIGQFVGVGARLGRIFSTEIVEVRLPLTDQQLAELGLPVAYTAKSRDEAPEVTLEATLAGQVRQWKGRIMRTDAVIDRETRLYHAIAEVVDPYGDRKEGTVPLPVGLFVTAHIPGRQMKEAYIFPRAALRGNDRVYALDDEDRIVFRTVDVISSNAERVVVGGGVFEGERVVVSPVSGVREGMPVAPLSRENSAALASIGN